MKLILVIIGCIILLAALNNILLTNITGVYVTCDAQQFKVCRWSSYGYDSWGWEYSYGQQFQPGGTFLNLWHWPKWKRVKIRYNYME